MMSIDSVHQQMGEVMHKCRCEHFQMLQGSRKSEASWPWSNFMVKGIPKLCKSMLWFSLKVAVQLALITTTILFIQVI